MKIKVKNKLNKITKSIMFLMRAEELMTFSSINIRIKIILVLTMEETLISLMTFSTMASQINHLWI